MEINSILKIGVVVIIVLAVIVLGFNFGLLGTPNTNSIQNQNVNPQLKTSGTSSASSGTCGAGVGSGGCGGRCGGGSGTGSGGCGGGTGAGSGGCGGGCGGGSGEGCGGGTAQAQPVQQAAQVTSTKNATNTVTNQKPTGKLVDAENAAIDYYTKNYGDNSVTAKAVDRGCHVEVNILKDGKKVRYLGYSGGTIYDLGS